MAFQLEGGGRQGGKNVKEATIELGPGLAKEGICGRNSGKGAVGAFHGTPVGQQVASGLLADAPETSRVVGRAPGDGQHEEKGEEGEGRAKVHRRSGRSRGFAENPTFLLNA